MPTYEFACEQCGSRFSSPHYETMRAPCCGVPARRLYTFQGFHRKWNGGYSPAVGRYVQNDHALDEALKAGSEAASEDTGMEHRYRRVDPRELASKE